MTKRALCLGLLLLATLFAEGCCWCNRPFLSRRRCWGANACCAPGGATSCCDGGAAIDSMAPPMAHPLPGPSMPQSVPLARLRMGNR